ncbi:hypothetical protein ACH4SP_14175 [Streptomyces sp. NPDC021093]|uniref:hypothetical protein n=1 Tax=Streptomyces sp. NPDC021093 TaxID=3365112 RepID=UPI0037A05605
MRRFLPPLLLALVALLVPVNAVAVWADAGIEDTGRYVTTMAPLAEDPDVQKAVTDRLTSEIMKQVDLGPLQNGAERLLGEAARSFAGTDTYDKAWNTVSRVTHDALRNALTADKGSGDTVALDLAPVIAELKQRLTDDGVPLAGRIPVVHTDITLLRTDQLDTWRTVYHTLAPTARWLPPVTALLVVGSILLAVRGRRLLTTALAGLALVAGALLLALALAVAHNLALTDLPQDVGRAAAEAVYSTLTGALRTTAWAVGAVGLVVAAGAGGAWWVAGRRRESGPLTRSAHSPRDAAGSDAR